MFAQSQILTGCNQGSILQLPIGYTLCTWDWDASIFLYSAIVVCLTLIITKIIKIVVLIL